MLDWRTDTYVRTSLRYDLKLEVLDTTGRTLAENRITGDQDLGAAGGLDPLLQRLIPSAQQGMLTRLFNDAGIQAALGYTRPPGERNRGSSDRGLPPSN